MPETAPAPETKTITATDLQMMAHNYHVPMSEGTIQQIAGEGPINPAKAQAFEDHLKTTAAGLYPTFAKQIQAGIPTAFLLDPYRQVGKRVLGEEFEPDFLGNTSHARALHGGIDPATNRPTPMPLNEWENYLKTEPSFGWSKTPNGQRAHQQILNLINQHFTQGGQQ